MKAGIIIIHIILAKMWRLRDGKWLCSMRHSKWQISAPVPERVPLPTSPWRYTSDLSLRARPPACNCLLLSAEFNIQDPTSCLPTVVFCHLISALTHFISTRTPRPCYPMTANLPQLNFEYPNLRLRIFIFPAHYLRYPETTHSLTTLTLSPPHPSLPSLFKFHGPNG